MNDFSIRSNQLKSIKAKYILKDFFLIFSFSVFVLSLLTLYVVGSFVNSEKFKLIYHNVGFIIFIFLIFALVIIGFIFLILKIIKKDNHKFHQLYLDNLFKECRLEEIYYKFRKRILDENIIEDIENEFGVNKINPLYSLTDASPSRVLDYIQCSYKKDNLDKYGVILVVKIEEFLDGFLQIRTKGEPIKKEYEGKTIMRFGFSSRSELSSLEVFSSLGSSTYNLQKNEFVKLINDFKAYIRNNFIITYNGNVISILIEDFQFNLTNNYLNFRQDDFERKINSLIRLHKLSDELITYLMSFKV